MSSEYYSEKNFFKIFYSMDLAWPDRYLQFLTCRRISWKLTENFWILFSKTTFIWLSEYISHVHESPSYRHEFQHNFILVRKKKFFFSLFYSPFPQTLIINYSEHRFWKGLRWAFIWYTTRHYWFHLAATGHDFTFWAISRNPLVQHILIFGEKMQKIMLFYVVESVFEKSKKKNFFSKNQLFLGLPARGLYGGVPIISKTQDYPGARLP